MKKSTKAILLTIIILITLLGVLFVPYRKGLYDDGGTEDYRALAATYVKWQKLQGDGTKYEGFSWYLYPDSQKSIDELWEIKH